jgi:hypothetical protein
MLQRPLCCNFGIMASPNHDNNSSMNRYSSHTDDDSDFGHTVPGQRSGEGSGSILPYLANSLKVNPNIGALPIARESGAGAKRRKKSPAQAGPVAPSLPTKPTKPAR